MTERSDLLRAQDAERVLTVYAHITGRSADLAGRQTMRQLADSLRVDLDAYIRIVFAEGAA